MGNASSTLLLAALAGALSAGLATSCAKEFNDCRVSRTCKRSDGGAPNGGGTAGAGLDAGRGGLGAAAGFSGSAASGGTLGGASGRDGGGNGEDGGSDDVGGAGGNGHGGSGGDNGHGAAAEGGHKAAGGSHGAGGSHAGAGDSGNTAESGHGGEAGDGGDNGGGTHAGVGGLGGLGGGPTGPDTQPPHIVSISPEYGAIGVRADADIVVTFDEPMDEAETNQAYESDDLLPSRVSLSWSNDAQTLTIHPQDGLDYVPTTPETPRVYSFSISTFARDVAGNHLESAETGAFAMLLPVSEDVAPSGAQSIFRRVNTDLVSKVCDSQADVQVGLVGSSPQGLVVEFPMMTC